MTGVNGDLYLDTTTSNVYKKTGGVWNIICNIKGATGAAGPQGPMGSGGSLGPYTYLIRKNGADYEA
jgi:hypothetical protein